MEEQSQPADVADLARFGYNQELRLAQAIEDQSLEWANGVDYGLAALVWTRDVGRALRMARKLQFGTVWINTHIPLVNEMPHGGYKQSGYGKDMWIYSLEEYTQIKHVMASHGLTPRKARPSSSRPFGRTTGTSSPLMASTSWSTGVSSSPCSDLRDRARPRCCV